MAEVTLEMLGELMQRMLAEMREMRGEMAELRDRAGSLESAVSGIKDELLVHGAILMRLDARTPISQDDHVMAAMQQQILRLERRVSKLEGHA